MLTLRPACAADAPVLAALSIETWLNTYIRGGLGSLHADYVLREFSMDAMAQAICRDQITVAEEGGGMTGYARVRHDQAAPVGDCHGTELVTLYIRPARHRQGMGRALLSEITQQAKLENSPSLWLNVNCKNQRAQAFYTAHGFTVVGQTDFVLKGTAYPNFLLRLDLR